MMGRRLVILLLLLLPLNMVGQDYGRLDTLLLGFFEALKPETVEAKNAEYDALIASCADPETRRRVVLTIFDHYKDDPPVMGEEEVAIHVYDKWLADGSIPMRGEFDSMEAEMFVNFNRSTMIGCRAPEVTLMEPCGRRCTVPSAGRTSILFFYDTSCAKCRAEIEALPSVLSKVDFPTDFHAVYCGQDRRAWRKFRRSFRIGGGTVTVHHLWDPEIESDYLKLYGVISTPRMYIIEPGGLVIGRRLEPESLLQMLPVAKTIQNAYEKAKQD